MKSEDSKAIKKMLTLFIGTIVIVYVLYKLFVFK